MLGKIKEKLEELNSISDVKMEKIAYGLLPRSIDVRNWNYLIFSRSHIKKSGTSKGDFNEYYVISIVHEDFIPEGYIYEVIGKLEEIKGFRRAEKDIAFSYVKKGSTDTVVEVASIVFTRSIYAGKIL